MAKTILVTFNQDGSIVQNQSSAVGIRKGDGDGEVTISAVFTNRSNSNYVAKAHFERPDGKRATVVMIPSATSGNRFDYNVESAWFFAVAGTGKVTITITDGTGAVAAQGLYAFAIEDTTVDVIDSTLTYDEAAALEGLIAQQSEALQSAVAKLMNGETVVGKALRDADGNIISQTYAQDSRVAHLQGDERISGVKEFVGAIRAATILPATLQGITPRIGGPNVSDFWEGGYFKNLHVGYLRNGNDSFVLPNSGTVIASDAMVEGAANTAKEQAISASKTYTDNQKNALQAEIDTVNATQNVVDIVDTKANLLAYDTTNLQSGDKIEVLADESQSGANTIYSFENSAWALIGSKAPYYSVAQIDALLAYYVTAIGLAATLDDYATKNYLVNTINETCVSLTKGGYVNMAEAPSSPNTYYFGAKNGTTSFLRLSDNSFDVKTTRGDVVMQFMLNFSNSNLARFVKIDGSTTPAALSVTDVPFKAGTHELVLDDDLTEANAKITALESKTSKQESDIQYLYRQVIGGGDLVTDTDSSVSLTSQPFPLTVSPKALLDYVGGMCQKVNQLVNNSTVTSNGITFSFGNGIIAISGTPNQSWAVYKNTDVKANHKYLVNIAKMTGIGAGLVIRVYNSENTYRIVDNRSIVTIGANETYIQLRLSDLAAHESVSGSALWQITDITDAYPTDTPTSTSDARIQWLMAYLASHPEYDAGSIITAPVTMVVSKGFNLWDEEWELGGYNDTTGEKVQATTKIRNKNPIKVLPSTTYYGVCPSSGYGLQVYFYDKDMNFISLLSGWVQNSTFTTPSNCYYINFAPNSLYGTTYNHDICINVSSSLNGTYKPYRAPIYYPIPAEVQALEGYGYGLSATLFNKTDLESKKYVKVIVRVDLGSLDWTKATSYGIQEFYSFGLRDFAKKPSANSVKANIMCAKYTTNTRDSGLANMIAMGTTGELIITDQSDVTAAQFKASLDGIYLYYELATPTETDISEYIDSDVVEVTAGGRLEFENEDDMGVPYSVTYQCEPNP